MNQMKISPTIRASQELLGVNAEVTAVDLKKAYHKLALLYHPDRNANVDAAAEFRKITEAYELLNDPLQVRELNRKYMTERLHKKVIDGLDITFGTFFGYRHFKPNSAARGSADVGLLKGKSVGRSLGRAQSLNDDLSEDLWTVVEENNSILDHPAFDAIEVVYAGTFSKKDEEAVKGEVDGKNLSRLPWVVLNNQGLLKFLEGDLRKSTKCYRELCERIPNNIIFMYRYGLCLILEGFQTPKRTLLGVKKPDAVKIAKGLHYLEICIKLGEERKVGRQKCLVIRKTVADVKERLGQRSQTKKLWKAIRALDPKSVEAIFRVEGREAAQRLLKRKAQARASDAASLAAANPQLLARQPKA